MRKSWILMICSFCLVGCLALMNTPAVHAQDGGDSGTCEGDVDGDGFVTVLDLLAVLGDFGECAGCPTDINGDDVVDVMDLLAVLGNFGPCGEPQCETNEDCDDGDPCTIDLCIGGFCANIPDPDCE